MLQQESVAADCECVAFRRVAGGWLFLVHWRAAGWGVCEREVQATRLQDGAVNGGCRGAGGKTLSSHSATSVLSVPCTHMKVLHIT